LVVAWKQSWVNLEDLGQKKGGPVGPPKPKRIQPETTYGPTD
jgi:hypothetical protein